MLQYANKNNNNEHLYFNMDPGQDDQQQLRDLLAVAAAKKIHASFVYEITYSFL